MPSQSIQFLLPFATLVATLMMSSETTVAFAPSAAIAFAPRSTVLWSSSTESSTDAANADATAQNPAAGNFIGTEMRKAAMKLHNFKQSPKEGGVEAPKEDKYVPTVADYLSFLVNSKHVYEALEEIVNAKPELACFRNTGMERTIPLETDIGFMMQEYGLPRPEPGTGGKGYAQKLRDMAAVSIPEFVCHYYNFSFAHTAGGRMIGNRMSALLLDKKTLEFYKVRTVHEFTVTFVDGIDECRQ
jgi:hypothetical protein